MSEKAFILTINGGSSSIKFALYEALKPLKRGLHGTVDRHRIIRYLVVETGTWLVDRQVLVSPYALAAVNNEE